MWEARAEYEDGTTIERLFADQPDVDDNEMQYRLESWLICKHPGCTWYSVNYIYEEE